MKCPKCGSEMVTDLDWKLNPIWVCLTCDHEEKVKP